MSRADRAESVATLRSTAAARPRPTPAWAAAALLHDVGKTGRGLGTVGRVLATARGHGRRPGRESAGRAGSATSATPRSGAEVLQAGGRPAGSGRLGPHPPRSRPLAHGADPGLGLRRRWPERDGEPGRSGLKS